VWGGVECTVNRIGEAYLDQLEKSGHARRIEDLELFAALGIRALRYPILWERTMADGSDTPDWSWADERLGRLSQLGLRPIVGLLHHGSGPRHTSLVDSAFPSKLARYARAVAERYPWVEDYTPVNEPLTTARFSALYGYWYPHARDDGALVRALLNQCRATVLSMRAIREVNPAARLVQTEDLGKTYSTPALTYQAQFENERRWLTFDLLCGRVNREHPLWSFLKRAGADERELEWFIDNSCPPDLIGINHYLTSERFIDQRLGRYPPHTHGGNNRQRYADVEAVRVLAEGVAGPRALLAETWARYELPLAVTEAHLGCTREEQLRWLLEVWEAACALRGEGVDIRAVTVWALLGSYDWDSLLTSDRGRYESGVFDLRGGRPRPTALASLVRELAAGRRPTHPVLDTQGWWRRLDRLMYPPVRRRGRTSAPAVERKMSSGIGSERPLLIVGARGTLGRAFARACEERSISYHLLARDEMDIAEPASVAAALERLNPWAMVNAAGYVRVDDAEREPALCLRENAEGPAVLAALCAAREVSLVTFSSDLVFDGAAGRPYVEGDTPAPLNVYGRSKAEAESRVLATNPAALVIRTSAFFGPWDDYNFVTLALRALAAGETFVAASDAVVSPTYVPDLTSATLDLLIDGEVGIWHLSNNCEVTWAELARLAARLAGLDEELIEGVPSAGMGYVAARPLYSALGSERGAMLPSLDDALRRYMAGREVAYCGHGTARQRG
jgi:dTDP-4-dehydrorhamnose reductase